MQPAPQYFLVKNLARSATARSIRQGSPGGHKFGFVLDDGSRVRCAGIRYTNMDFGTFTANQEKILTAVKEGFIEIRYPDEKVVSMPELQAFAGNVPPVAEQPRAERKHEHKPEPVVEPPKVEQPKPESIPDPYEAAPAEEIKEEPKAEEPKVEEKPVEAPAEAPAPPADEAKTDPGISFKKKKGKK